MGTLDERWKVTVKELREYLTKLGEELDDYEVVYEDRLAYTSLDGITVGGVSGQKVVALS
jgi:hypothetical protein